MASNAVGPTGLTIQSRSDVVQELLNGSVNFPGLFAIYGANINVNPNSPDAQLVNIVAQTKIDVLQLVQATYTSFDPDQATGTSLDERCAINGVQRFAGSYTQTYVSVTVTQACTLLGLDTAPGNPFTVADSAGNQFQNKTTTIFGGAGTQSLLFQAAKVGAVSAAANTLTVLSTIQLGVSTVNNPAAVYVQGVDEETDYALRIRRAKSVALPSIGSLDGLTGGLLSTSGVTLAKVFENSSGATDGNSVPAHSIWAIIAGGTDADVARMLYIKRNMGCGMKGSTTVSVGSPAVSIKFDRPTVQNLWISFTASAITGSVDVNYIRAQLLAKLTYDIGQSADTTSIVALIKSIAPNATVSAEGVSATNSGYTTLVAPTAVNYLWVPASVRVVINGVPGV